MDVEDVVVDLGIEEFRLISPHPPTHRATTFLAKKAVHSAHNPFLFLSFVEILFRFLPVMHFKI
jgi:hypothetical protein